MPQQSNKKKNLLTVSVIGLGYIGLPTAAVVASRKIHVIGVDINQSTVDVINNGQTHIVEPGLDMLVHAAITEGYLRAVLEPESADVFLIAVPTPLTSDNKPDLSHVESAAQLIAPVLKKGNLIIIESTSPVGTTEQIAHLLAQFRDDLTFPQTHGDQADICLAHCPERVLPGHILRELVQNHRVIGGMTPACSAAAMHFYKLFVEGDCIVTSARTAELCKLAENSFRDVNVAFANEISMICDKLNINVSELIRLANYHPRVSILKPGPGVGGHCIAVDPWFIVNSAPDEAKLIATARAVNDSKPLWVIARVKLVVGDFLRNNPEKTERDVTIACFGITFKADIDDLRESPALEITKAIAETHQGHVVVVEPYLSALPNELAHLAELDGIEHALAEADIVVMLVNHKQFKSLPTCLHSQTCVVDACGVWPI